MLSPNNNTQIPSPSKKIDALIVGAGPVGLLAACLLSQADMTVRILDAEFEPNHWGRGDNMHGRTMELLERAGLEEELLQSGARVDNFNIYNNTKMFHSMPFVPDYIDSKYKYLLCVGQHITESSLQNHLANHDVQVERPWTVTSIQDNLLGENKTTHPLIANISDLHDHTTDQIEVKYVLGCDGAHSDIRRQLGIVYDGDSAEISGGVIDALIRTNFPGKKDFCLLQGPSSKTLSFFPRENGLVRLLVHFSENESNDLGSKDRHDRTNIQMEDIQREAKRALMPYRLEILGALYWSTYLVGQRQATTMDGMNERVFLLGDAAHCQSPALGQGINTGFGDAFNLIWKLSLVERGVLDRNVLKTYTLERHAVAKRVLDIDKVAAKEAASHQSEKYAQVVQGNSLFTSGFGIDYIPQGESINPLLWQGQKTVADHSTSVMAGARAPNAKVIKASTGKKARLFDQINWLTFSILVLAHDLTVPGILLQVEKVHAWFKDSATVKLGSKTGFTIATTTTNVDVLDLTASTVTKDDIVIDKLNRAQCHRDYGCDSKQAPGTTLVIIRPDGYIGAICHGDSMVTQAQEYIDQVCI
ncbi:FAD binding domain-domain-containing protein [Absidia repens]|uniref:FAD binding domain-domain-containing protein n=1 Tax=Absidia repens TaxID=90262 RepID=A0A1X2IJX5_9FUNG|nr:FAD binding domain-domain-containing protein [Absidia repens]